MLGSGSLVKDKTIFKQQQQKKNFYMNHLIKKNTMKPTWPHLPCPFDKINKFVKLVSMCATALLKCKFIEDGKAF